MFPRQDRDTGRLFPIRHLGNRKHRQGDEGAGGGVHFQGHGAEQPLPNRIAVHRPREVGRIGAGNAWSMSQDVCPLASRGKLAASRSTPSRSKSQRTSAGLDSRLWIATPVVIPPSWRRTGKMASLMGELASTTATPMWGRS